MATHGFHRITLLKKMWYEASNLRESRMLEDAIKNRHDIKNAIRAMYNVAVLAARGYDFTTESGKAILKEADEAREWLETTLGVND
jgi:hypothetical protein